MAALTTSQVALCALIFGAGVVSQPLIKQGATQVAKKVKKPSKPFKTPVNATPRSVAPSVAAVVEPCEPFIPSIDLQPTDIPLLSTKGNFDDTRNFDAPHRGFVPVHPVVVGNSGVLAVPEPDTWLMLISGFGLIGLSLRNNRGGDDDGLAV